MLTLGARAASPRMSKMTTADRFLNQALNSIRRYIAVAAHTEALGATEKPHELIVNLKAISHR